MYPTYDLKAICLYCGQPNLETSLECRKCGAPLYTREKSEEQYAYVGTYVPENKTDEVSVFENKAMFDGNVIKQVVEYKQIYSGSFVAFHIPRAGIITKILIENLDINPSEWRIEFTLGNIVPLVHVSKWLGKYEIRRVTDTNMMMDSRIELKSTRDNCEGVMVFTITRWVHASRHK